MGERFSHIVSAAGKKRDITRYLKQGTYYIVYVLSGHEFFIF